MKQVMYIGPDIKGVVRKNQIFTYMPEDVIAQACEHNKFAQHLFVQMDDIVQKRRELRIQGTFLNLAYKKIENGREINDRL